MNNKERAAQTHADKRLNSSLPIGKNEDVEFSPEVADENDIEAFQRAEAADARQEEE